MKDLSKKEPRTSLEGPVHSELERVIRKAVSLRASGSPTPDPAIRARLLQHMRDSGGARRNSWQLPVLLNRALRHPIPLYQAVLALALVLLLLLPAVESINNSQYQSGSVIADSTMNHESQLQLAASDSMPGQNVPALLGRTMREDSLLLRLIVSTR